MRTEKHRKPDPKSKVDPKSNPETALPQEAITREKKKNHSKNRKKVIILSVVISVLSLGALGTWLYLQYLDDQKTVEVMPVSQISTSYWGDQSQSSGMVTNDYVQELYVDSAKVISDIYVENGATVAVGDKLLQYDKTKLELAVESKEIALKEADVKITTAQRQLEKLQNTTPVASPTTPPLPDPDPDPNPPDPPLPPVPTASPAPTLQPGDVTVYSRLDLTSVPYKGSGTTGDPYVFLCTNDCVMTGEFIRWLFGPGGTTPAPTALPTESPTEAPDPIPTPVPLPTLSPAPSLAPQPSTAPTPETQGMGHAGGPLPMTTAAFSGAKLPVRPLAEGETWEEDNTGWNEEETWDPSYGEESQGGAITLPLTSPFAARFEVREGNSNYGRLLYAFTLDGTNPGGQFTPGGVLTGDNTISDVADAYKATGGTGGTGTGTLPDITYTRAELNKLIAEKKLEIQELQFQRKQAKLNVDKAALQLKNSLVLSNVDGVVALTDMEEAAANKKPFLVVSGSSNYYLTGVISENLLGTVGPGTELQAMSWETNQSYAAQIVSISDYPLEGSEGMYYDGTSNPNSSSYTFTAVIADPTGLTKGSHLNVMINVNAQPTSDSNALYVDKAYLREDDGGYYAMKAGMNNRLTKQYLQIGKSIYNSMYLEVISGLTIDDYVAFPYGPDMKEGVRMKLKGSDDPLDVLGDPQSPEGEGGLTSLPSGEGTESGATSGTESGVESVPQGEDDPGESGPASQDSGDSGAATPKDGQAVAEKEVIQA